MSKQKKRLNLKSFLWVSFAPSNDADEDFQPLEVESWPAWTFSNSFSRTDRYDAMQSSSSKAFDSSELEPILWNNLYQLNTVCIYKLEYLQVPHGHLLSPFYKRTSQKFTQEVCIVIQQMLIWKNLFHNIRYCIYRIL